MDHIADAPIANILIFAGVIFLAVGLFGRIGGYVGRIFGNIEAGNSSRVLAGVLGSLLILGGAWMHQQGDKSAPSHPNPALDPKSGGQTPQGSTGPSNPETVPSPNAAPGSIVRPVPPDPVKANPADLPAAQKAQPKIPPPQPVRIGDDRLIDTWTNVIPPQGNAAVATKIEISRSSQGLAAHIWYKCNTGVCDSGTHPLSISGNTCKFDFTGTDGKRRVGEMHVFAPNVLLLSADVYELGTQNHWHRNRVFTGPNLSGSLQTAFSQYVDAPSPKAFAMTPGGAWSSYRKSKTVEEGAQWVLKYCEDHGWHDCQIILLNDEGPQ